MTLDTPTPVAPFGGSPPPSSYISPYKLGRLITKMMRVHVGKTASKQKGRTKPTGRGKSTPGKR